MIEHPVNVILFMSNNLTLSGCQNARDGENGHLYGTMTIFIVCHNPYFLPPPLSYSRNGRMHILFLSTSMINLTLL